MPGVSSPGAPGVAHTGLTASPTLAQSIPHATPTPQHLQSCAHSHAGAGGGENGQTQDPYTPSVSLRPCELHLSWFLAWADLPGLLYTHAGPSLTTRCLHPYRAILLTASCLHPCPSAPHPLWADPGGCLLWLRLPLLPSFSLSLSLSFLCLPPSIGASNHRYP